MLRVATLCLALFASPGLCAAATQWSLTGKPNAVNEYGGTLVARTDKGAQLSVSCFRKSNGLQIAFPVNAQSGQAITDLGITRMFIGVPPHKQGKLAPTAIFSQITRYDDTIIITVVGQAEINALLQETAKGPAPLTFLVLQPPGQSNTQVTVLETVEFFGDDGSPIINAYLKQCENA